MSTCFPIVYWPFTALVDVDERDKVQPKRRRKSLMSTSSLGLDDKPIIDGGCASTVVELK